MSNLLNRTVCTGIVLGAVIDTRNGSCRVGNGLTRANPVTITPIPLLQGDKGAEVFLYASHRLVWDDEGRYLTSVASAFRVSADPSGDPALLRYEYVRGNAPHPEAHIHVHGEWGQPLLGVSPPRKLHLPVGGRRFRPTLEDLIEFLVNEGFCSGRAGWQQAVKDHRDDWMELQLKAAVRRSPEAAKSILREMGEIP